MHQTLPRTTRTLAAFRMLSAVAASVTLAFGLAFSAPPQSATAAGGVEVSPDGVGFSSTYPGALFGSIGKVVPGQSQQQSFYLRNSGNEPGFLRITLSDVTATDADFAGALSVSASTPGNVGTPATILEANPCWVLLEGQVVAPGQTVRVTTALALSDLQGQAGQGASAELALRVALSGTSAQLPPTSCGNGTTVPVVPALRPVPGAAAPGGSVDVQATASAPPVQAEPKELPVLGLPAIIGIDPNTWHLFEEYWVFVPITAFIVGTAWFAFIAWRRRKNEGDPEEMDAIG